DNPARQGSPNRSGWAAIRVIMPGTGVASDYVGSEMLDLDSVSKPLWLLRRVPLSDWMQTAAGGTNGHDGTRHNRRRDALTGRYRRAAPGAGRGRAAAGAPPLS